MVSHRNRWQGKTAEEMVGQHTGVHRRGLTAAAGLQTISGLQRSMSSPKGVSTAMGSARSVPGRRPV